jgi:hypothetical protein
MKHFARLRATLSLTVAAILAASVPSAYADEADSRNAEIRALRAQVEAMNTRLKELEIQARNSVVVSPDKVATPQAAATAPTSSSPVIFSGEVRARAESIDEEGMRRRHRDRIRARAGATVRVTGNVQAVTRISTGGHDPRASNATLTGESAKKDVDLDLAYVQWQPLSSVIMRAGKLVDPIWRPTHSPLLSAEVTPEGWSASFGQEGAGLFGSLGQFWLEERPVDADSSRYIAQLGYQMSIADVDKLRIAASYQDFKEVQFRKPFFDGVSSYGNSVLSDGTLANDFNTVSLAAQFDMHVLLRPFSLFAEAARNIAADDQHNAASVGAAFGDCTQPRGWLIAYHYTWLEKDALFGQIVNVEFGNGNTDSRGHSMKIAYGLAKNWTLGLTLTANDLNVDVGQSHSFKRAQFDLHAKY